MATRARDVSPLTLPARARAVQAHSGDIPAKLDLADRVPELPESQVADRDPAGGSRNVDLTLPPASLRATWFDGLPRFSRTNLQ